MSKIRAKAIADVSLQFYRDKEGTPNFMITTNEADTIMTGVDAVIFGERFAQSENLTKDEKLLICSVFTEALRQLQPPTSEGEGER